jgi:hypothetical protein
MAPRGGIGDAARGWGAAGALSSNSDAGRFASVGIACETYSCDGVTTGEAAGLIVPLDPLRCAVLRFGVDEKVTTSSVAGCVRACAGAAGG